MEKNCEKPELTPEELEALKKRHIRSFVMRRGHISAAQKRALDESLPQYQIEYAPELLDADKAFGRHAPLVLEIGCGMGETTAAIAQAHPEVNFLGCEVFVAGVGALAIFTFINSWNDYFMQLIMLSSTKNLTISLGIAKMQAENSTDFGLIMAGAAFAAVPIIIVFLIFQKYFTKGITMGAVKG